MVLEVAVVVEVVVVAAVVVVVVTVAVEMWTMGIVATWCIGRKVTRDVGSGSGSGGDRAGGRLAGGKNTKLFPTRLRACTSCVRVVELTAAVAEE